MMTSYLELLLYYNCQFGLLAMAINVIVVCLLRKRKTDFLIQLHTLVMSAIALYLDRNECYNAMCN